MEWIKVEDSLPDEGVDVLIYAPNSKFKFYTGDYLHKKIRDCSIGWWVSSNLHKGEWDEGKSWLGKVTHWMQLPEAPKQTSTTKGE
jgi:hypothetical protein